MIRIKMKARFIKIPIWNRKFLLVSGCNKEQLLSLVSKYQMGRELRNMVIGDPPNPKDQGCLYMGDKTGKYIMVFPNRKVRTDTIIHETNHLVKHMMKFIGAQQETEGASYTQEFLYNWIRKNL